MRFARIQSSYNDKDYRRNFKYYPIDFLNSFKIRIAYGHKHAWFQVYPNMRRYPIYKIWESEYGWWVTKRLPKKK